MVGGTQHSMPVWMKLYTRYAFLRYMRHTLNHHFVHGCVCMLPFYIMRLWFAFRFIIFDRMITTRTCGRTCNGVLWFAFRFIIFDRMITTELPREGHDLLLWFAFRFIIFDRMITTGEPGFWLPSLLWFAFRFIIFDRMITTKLLTQWVHCRCDLLSDLLSLTEW